MKWGYESYFLCYEGAGEILLPGKPKLFIALRKIMRQMPYACEPLLASSDLDCWACQGSALGCSPHIERNGIKRRSTLSSVDAKCQVLSFVQTQRRMTLQPQITPNLAVPHLHLARRLEEPHKSHRQQQCHHLSPLLLLMNKSSQVCRATSCTLQARLCRIILFFSLHLQLC